MPRYDFCCARDHVFEVYLAPRELGGLDLGTYTVPCPACGTAARWKPSAQIQPAFTPHWNEHLANRPVFVESREHYRQLLVESDSYGPYVEPGSPIARAMIEMHDERRAKERAYDRTRERAEERGD